MERLLCHIRYDEEELLGRRVLLLELSLVERLLKLFILYLLNEGLLVLVGNTLCSERRWNFHDLFLLFWLQKEEGLDFV